MRECLVRNGVSFDATWEGRPHIYFAPNFVLSGGPKSKTLSAKQKLADCAHICSNMMWIGALGALDPDSIDV
jgi:hypothetical protein